MVQIVPGDLIQVALPVQQRMDLDHFCDMTERTRSEVVQDAIKQYLSLHGPFVMAAKQLEELSKQMSGRYQIEIPPELR